MEVEQVVAGIADPRPALLVGEERSGSTEWIRNGSMIVRYWSATSGY
jgi:hypothetical protein